MLGAIFPKSHVSCPHSIPDDTKVNPTNFRLAKRAQFIACLVFFLGFLLVTIFITSFHPIDVIINLWIPSIQSRGITMLAEGVAIIFDTSSLVILCLIISSVLYLKNYKGQGLLLLGAMAGDALLVSVLKNLDHIARPTNAIVADSSFSYPSGHCAGAVVFMGVLAYFAWRHWQSTLLRTIVGVGLGAVVGVVGFDRIYLGVHWLSDVFGGWLFGAFWLSFVILVFQQLQKAKKFESERFSWVASLLFGFAVVVAITLLLFNFGVF